MVIEILDNGTPIPPRTRLNIVGATFTDSATNDQATMTVQVGDITAVTAGNGLSGGGASGAVSLTVNQAYAFTWTNNHVYAPTAATSGVPTALTVTGAADTGQTAGTEKPLVHLNGGRTVTWATGALTTQREVLLTAPTYAFAAASTITNAATLAITNAPQPGTNATLTNAYALWVQAGATRLDGAVNLGRGTVSQLTDINTNVTVNTSSGVITTQAASTAAATVEAGFTVNNSLVTSTSVITATIVGYSGTYVTNGYPFLVVGAPGSGSFTIKVGNSHAANALNGTMKIHFTVT